MSATEPTATGQAERGSGGVSPRVSIPTGNTYDKYGSANPVVKRLMGGFHGTLDELWGKAAPESILYVGCGEGVLTVEWAERLGEGRVVDLSEQPAVIVLTEHKEFDPEGYEKDKVQTKQQVLRQKREQTFSQWSNDLRRQAEERREIAVNPSLLAVF